MKTTTELQIEYVYLSWNYDFPSMIESILEADYVANSHLYDESTLKRVWLLLLIAPDTSRQEVLNVVRNDCLGSRELSEQEEK